MTNREAAQQIIENPLSYLKLPEDLKNDKHLALLAIQTNTENIHNTIKALDIEIKDIKSNIHSSQSKLEALHSPSNKYTTPQEDYDEIEELIYQSKESLEVKKSLINEAMNTTRIFHHLGDQLNSDPEFLKVILDQELMSLVVPTSARILDSVGYEMNDVGLDSLLSELISDNKQLEELTGFNINLHETYDQALEIDKAEKLNHKKTS